jgi:hypothetical protein
MNLAERDAASRGGPGDRRVRSRHRPRLGGLLVKEGLINRVQLQKALTLQQALEPCPLLGQMLLAEKLITSHELGAVLGKYHRRDLLGDVLIEAKAVTPSQLEAALASRRKTDGLLGDTLIQLGFITERQLKQALSIQLGIQFVDLDSQPVDPGAAALISEHYARHHRVIPIARVDGRIVLAMDDPTDIDVVAEVRSCTGQPTDVVTATGDALERALSRCYGNRGDTRPPARTTRVVADEAAGRESAEPMTRAVASEQVVNRPIGDTPHGRGSEPTRSGVALDAIRARIDVLRHAARVWERRAGTVEALLRERVEQRAEIDRLARKLRESRTTLAEAHQELEAKIQAVTRLEQTRVTMLHDREALEHSLRELQARYDALMLDRDFVIDRVGAILERLRS